VREVLVVDDDDVSLFCAPARRGDGYSELKFVVIDAPGVSAASRRFSRLPDANFEARDSSVLSLSRSVRTYTSVCLCIRRVGVCVDMRRFLARSLTRPRRRRVMTTRGEAKSMKIFKKKVKRME
jgi:hypothetical protein